MAEIGIEITKDSEGRTKGVISQNFKDKLLSATDPVIFTVVGNRGTGKSLLLNKILCSNTFPPPDLKVKEPFPVDESLSIPFQGFNFFGPIKAGRLGSLNHFCTDCKNDIFFVDTGGVDEFSLSMGEITHIFFALEAVSSCLIFVSRGYTQKNPLVYLAGHVRSVQLFSGKQEHVPGLAVVEHVELNNEAIKFEYEDLKILLTISGGCRTTDITSFLPLVAKGIRLDETNFHCIIEPNFEDERNYADFTKELVGFMLKNCQGQSKKSGHEIADKFSNIESFFRTHAELFVDHNSFDCAFLSFVTGKLEPIKNDVYNEEKKQCSCDKLDYKSEDICLEYHIYKEECLSRAEHHFEEKANTLFNGIKNVAVDMYSKSLSSLKSDLCDIIKRSLSEHVRAHSLRLSKVVDSAAKFIVSETEKKVLTSLNKMTTSDLRTLNKSKFIGKVCKESAESFDKMIYEFGFDTKLSPQLKEAGKRSKMTLIGHIKDYTKKELEKKYGVVPVWPRNLKELIVEQGVNELSLFKRYTLYTKKREPYEVIVLYNELMLQGIKGRVFQCRKVEGKELYSKVFNLVNSFDSNISALVLENCDVFSHTWNEEAQTANSEGIRPLLFYQETRWFELHVNEPFVIKSFIKEGNAIAKIINCGHDLKAWCNNGFGYVRTIIIGLSKHKSYKKSN